MHRGPARIHALLVLGEPNLHIHVHTMHRGPRLHKRPIKKVPVISDEDMWPHVQHVVEKAPQERLFVRLVENGEIAFELWLRGVLEVLDILRDDLAVRDEETLYEADQIRGKL